MIFLLFTQMFPPVVMILGIFRLVAAYGLVDNLAVVAVIAASFNLAFCIWLLTGYFSAIPPEIEEAAMMDGHSRIGAMLKMTLPLSWPGLIAVGIFAFMDGWNEFLFSLTFIRTQEFLPLTIGLYRFNTRFQIQWNNLMTGAFLATIIVVALFMLVQDKLTRGWWRFRRNKGVSRVVNASQAEHPSGGRRHADRSRRMRAVFQARPHPSTASRDRGTRSGCLAGE